MKKINLILALVFLLVGCTQIKDTTKNISFPNPTANEDDKIDDTIKEIVEAFDNRDSKKIKSLLHKSVIEENPNIDNDIKKAFDLYEGTSIEYEKQSNESTIIDHGNIQYISYAGIKVITEQGQYTIYIAYNVSDKKNPQDEGIYAIKIIPSAFFEDYYYYAGDDTEKLKKYRKQLPDEIALGEPWNGYLEFGKGVFSYSLNDIKEAYYKKNGTEMIFHEGMSEEETKN